MLNHESLLCCSNSNLDLEPSAPYASASSFPSPIEFQNLEEPSLPYEKLQQICKEGTPSSRSLYLKPSTVSTSSKNFNLGRDVTSKVFPPPLPHSFQPFSALEVTTRIEKRPLSAYLSQNKIAYQIPQIGTESSSTSTLQGMLQKCGVKTISTTLDTQHVTKHQSGDSLSHSTSSRITEKIKNLDDMLKSLEHYSVTKRISSAVRSELDMKSNSNRVEHKQPRPMDLDTSLFEQQRTTTPGINKALSRLDFKTQMDKLTGVIEDRWFYGDNKKVETKNSVIMTSSSSAINEEPHPPQQDMSTITSNLLTPITSTNLLKDMLHRVDGVEHRLMTRDRKEQKKQNQSKQKGIDSKGRLSVQRPAKKRMTSLLQRQFRRHTVSINQRMDKTDLAIKYMKRQNVKVFLSSSSPQATNTEYGKESYLGRVNVDCQTESLTNIERSSNKIEVKTEEVNKHFVDDDSIEEQNLVTKNMQRMGDELCTLRHKNQYLSETVEKINKLYNEQSMEMELCWTAINHLCIDNDMFRDELRAYHTRSQKQPESTEQV